MKLTVYKFKATPKAADLAVFVRAKDLLDASRYMHLLQQLEPENYKTIDLNCVCEPTGEIEIPEQRAVIYDYPYPQVLK
jgi:hypothetical protein